MTTWHAPAAAFLVSLCFLFGCGPQEDSSPGDAGTQDSAIVCAAGTVQVSAGECQACLAGSYCAGGAAPSEECAAPDSRDADDDPSTPCIPYASVSAGHLHTCAVTELREVVCWGATEHYDPVPDDLGPVNQVLAGDFETCALLANGTVRCWSGEGGDVSEPPSNLTNVMRLESGPCAILDSGAVRCWGDRFSMSGAAPPTDLGPILDVDTRAASCAVSTDAGVRCWGFEFPSHLEPPEDLAPSVQVEVGHMFACALSEVGAVRCWGDSSYDDPSSITTPVASISTGSVVTCALLDTGLLQCFGYDGYNGQATPPTDLGTVVQVDLGSAHACAVTTAGEVRCWGYNAEGQATVPRL